MGHTLDKKTKNSEAQAKLRLVKDEPKPTPPKPEYKSAFARQSANFSDDLDKQIEAILSS